MSNKQIPEEDQEFIDRQLARIREKLIQGETTRLIRGVLNWHRTDLRMSSAKYFVESGTVSGALHEAIAKIVRNYFDFAVEQPLLNKYKNEIIESRKDLHPPQQGSAEEQIVTDLILIMEENRAAMVNAKINKWNDVLKSSNPFDCVIETYDDLISIIKNLPLKRAKNEEGLFDYLNSPAPPPSGEAGAVSDAVDFAKFLLQNFRASWIDEIKETGWISIQPPFKEYSTEGAYLLFKQSQVK